MSIFLVYQVCICQGELGTILSEPFFILEIDPFMNGYRIDVA